MSRVRVLIVAGDPLARAGLAALLAESPDLLVAGRVSGAGDLAAALQAHQPDVVLWEVGWKPEVALVQVAEAPKAAPVVVLVSDAADASGAWQAGAQGVLRRDASPERIAACLLAVTEGMVVVDSEYRAALARREPSLPPAPPQFGGDESTPVEDLTPRELEVLRLLAEGLPNKTIAQRLDISEHTVKFHVNALLGKLGVGSRTEAVVRATRLGLIFL